jgi:glycosyltransferase involved in cell wall biosynthesis
MLEQERVKISVITATWNCAATVEGCLASVAAQTWPLREHIVIDGASTDGTVDLIAKHLPALSVFVSEPDRGIYDALNKGITRARGDVIGFLHADDLYARADVLERIANAFADPEVCAVYGDLEYVDKDDVEQVVRHWRSSPCTSMRLRWGWMPPHPTLYVRRTWYERLGAFDLRYRIAADYECVLRLFSNRDFRTTYLPEVLVRMRTGGTSNGSVRNILRKSFEDWLALRRARIGAWGGVGALAWKNLEKLRQLRVLIKLA